MKKYLIFALVPFFTLAQADIDVVFERQAVTSIQVHDGAQLAELLFHAKLPSNIYWRSAQIANPATTASILSAKETLLKDLKGLQELWARDGYQGALIQSTQLLLQELEKVPVSGRLPIELDPDLSRISAAANPQLEGRYTLFVAPRPNFIYLAGLIHAPGKQPIKSGAGLTDYWQNFPLMAGAEPSEAFLIQNDGTISHLPLASWNKLHREPMAGATLFVGFNPDVLPKQFKDINIRIANLLANRVPE